MDGRRKWQALTWLAFSCAMAAGSAACLHDDSDPSGPDPEAGLGAGEVEPPDWVPSGETPPGEDPAGEDPAAEDPPLVDPPAEDPPADDLPTEDPPADDPPAEDPFVGTDWDLVQDDLIYAGQRGVSPDPPPSLVVGSDGTPRLVFAARAGMNYQPLYALESGGDWQRYGDFTSSAHFAFAALGAEGTELPALRIIAPQYADFATEVWVHYDGGVSLLDTVPLHAGFAFSDSGAGAVLVGRTEAGEIALWREAGTSAEVDVLVSTESAYPVYAAALASDGTVGVLWYDTAFQEYRYIDTLGRDELVASGLDYAWYAPPVLAYASDGTPFAAIALPDPWPSQQVSNLLFQRSSHGDWSDQVLVDDITSAGVNTCPEEPAAPCPIAVETHRVIAMLPAATGIIPIVRRSTWDAHYERQCLEWDANPEACVLLCADEGGPGGDWQPDPVVDGLAETALLIGPTEVSLPGAPLGREISAVRDQAGRVHLATYEAIDPEDWSAGDNVRYLVLQPIEPSAGTE